MITPPTPTDAASFLNVLINMVMLVMLFLAKWELSRIETRIHRLEDVFFRRGAEAITHTDERG
jgi:cytochrome oxidase assembly protein ShyY1